MSQAIDQSSLKQSNFIAPPAAVPLESKNNPQLQSVMSELDRLSRSFVDSYQDLEGQVEKLNDQLIDQATQKENAIADKLKLSDRLQNLLAIMPAGVIVLDGEGVVRDCNAMATDILGRPLNGVPWVKVIQRAFQPQADDGHQVSLKDGRKIHIETKALDTEPGQLIVLTDLTKTRKLQAELSQQQKLSSMGKMVAFLAHQIRTPLSAAILYGSHLSDSKVSTELKRKFSLSLVERLHYMERQISDMLEFVKGERKQKRTIKVEDLFDNVQRLSEGFKPPVDFKLINAGSSAHLINADLDSLCGAVVNLIENANHACQTVAQPKISVVFNLARHLTIEVADNGIGIEPDLVAKIFEPFYTSKQSGNGLGLAVVHGIVIDHKGKIQVESEINQGTRFSITLPLEIKSDSPGAASEKHEVPCNEF